MLCVKLPVITCTVRLCPVLSVMMLAVSVVAMAATLVLILVFTGLAKFVLAVIIRLAGLVLCQGTGAVKVL